MPIYQIILIIAIVILVLSLLLNLLFSPITWIIVGILVLYSFVRRCLYEKQIKEYYCSRKADDISNSYDHLFKLYGSKYVDQ